MEAMIPPRASRPMSSEVQELDVLDAVPQRRRPGARFRRAMRGGALAGVEHDVTGGIPDGVHGAGNACLVGAQDVIVQLLLREPEIHSGCACSR